MKIAVTIETIDPARGGAEQWTSQFVRAVNAQGHEVHVIARHVSPELIAKGIHPQIVRAGRGAVEFAAEAERIARGVDADVIHDCGYGWHCDVLQPHGGSRLASLERNLELSQRWLRPLKRWIGPKLRRQRERAALWTRQFANEQTIYMAISRMVARDFERYHRVDPRRIRVVYNGVDVNRFTPESRGAHRAAVRDRLGIRDREIMLLIVAHNFRLKGVPTLTRATRLLRAEGFPVRAVVVGGKPPRATLKHELDGIAYIGSVARPESLYAAADVYVQPTFYDPCSLVVLEALASGLPVVTSRFNGAGELISPGHEGYIVQDPADADELCGALRPVLDDRRRAAMSIAARTLALQHSLDRNVRQIMDVYAECGGPARAAA